MEEVKDQISDRILIRKDSQDEVEDVDQVAASDLLMTRDHREDVKDKASQDRDVVAVDKAQASDPTLIPKDSQDKDVIQASEPKDQTSDVNSTTPAPPAARNTLNVSPTCDSISRPASGCAPEASRTPAMMPIISPNFSGSYTFSIMLQLLVSVFQLKNKLTFGSIIVCL